MPRRLALAYLKAYEGLPPAVWLLSTLMLISRCGTMFLPYLVILLTEQHDYSAAGAGQMVAVYGVGAVIGTYLGGALTARVGALRVIIGSLVVSSPAFLVVPWVTSPGPLAATLLYLSITREAVRPALSTATSDLCPVELHSKAFALNRLAFNLGLSIGAGVSAVIAGYGFALLFGFNAGVGMLAAVLMLRAFGWRSDPPPVGAPTDEATEDQATTLQESPNFVAAAPPLRSPWRDGPFLVFLVLQWLSGLVFFQLISTLPLFWKQQAGISESGIGVIFLVNTLLVVVLEMPLTDRLRCFPSLVLTAAGVGLVALGFGLTALEGLTLAGVALSGLPLAVAICVVWTAGEMLSAPFSMAYVASRAGPGGRAGFMGLNAASLSAANVAASVIGPRLYEIDPRLPWWCCLTMAAALPAGFLVLRFVSDRSSVR